MIEEGYIYINVPAEEDEAFITNVFYSPISLN